MEHKCQLPSLNKETGETIPCPNTDIKKFTYQGNDFYFCSDHFDLFSQNINNLYKSMNQKVEEIFKEI